MDVSFRAAYFVHIHARSVDAAAAEIMVHHGFNVRHEERSALLGVPGDVQVDLGIEIAAHGGFPRLGVAEAEQREAP
jgi:hypothetical protein